MANNTKVNRKIVFDALPGTAIMIAEKTGLSKSTAQRWLVDLAKAEEVHIYRYSYSANGGSPFEHYRAGKRKPGFVAYRPKVKPPVRRSKEYRKRLRDSGDYEDVKLKRKQQYYLQRNPNIDILTAHFYGGFSNDTP